MGDSESLKRIETSLEKMNERLDTVARSTSNLVLLSHHRGTQSRPAFGGLPMKSQPLSWQTTVLIMFVVTAVLGVSVWLVASELMPVTFVAIPIGTILLTLPTAIATYLKGQQEMPPSPPGMEFRLMPSIRPPPSEHSEDVSIPPFDASIKTEVIDHEPKK
jgi:hypothetical protein